MWKIDNPSQKFIEANAAFSFILFAVSPVLEIFAEVRNSASSDHVLKG